MQFIMIQFAFHKWHFILDPRAVFFLDTLQHKGLIGKLVLY